MWMETIAVLEANLERFPDAYRRLDRQMQRKLGMNKAWLSVRLFWEKDFARSIKYALAATRQYPPAVPIGAMQMAYSNLKGKRSVYLSAD